MLNLKPVNILVLSLLVFMSYTVTAAKSEVALSQAQIDEYNENGLVIIRNFLTQQEVAEVSKIAKQLQKDAQQLDAKPGGKIMYHGSQFIFTNNVKNTQLFKVVWVGAVAPELLAMAHQAKLLVPVSQLLGSDKADHIINGLYYHIPNEGVAFDWHQDITGRKKFDKSWKDLNNKGSYVQAIIAIDPMSAETGALYYVPKSHKRELFLDKEADKQKINSMTKPENLVPFTLNPGDIVFYHPYLVHGNEPNRMSTPHKFFINGFTYPGTINKSAYVGAGSAQRIDLK